MGIFNNQKDKKRRSKEEKEGNVVNEIDVTIDDIRVAINQYALKLDKGISLRIIVLDNNEIDYVPLQAHLGGKPNKTFYMSKETFEVFEDPAYPKYIDLCQIACDQYLLETNEEPIELGDKTRKISYFKLKNYLTKKPPFDLYLDESDRMVTHRNPADRSRKE